MADPAFDAWRRLVLPADDNRPRSERPTGFLDGLAAFYQARGPVCFEHMDAAGKADQLRVARAAVALVALDAENATGWARASVEVTFDEELDDIKCRSPAPDTDRHCFPGGHRKASSRSPTTCNTRSSARSLRCARSARSTAGSLPADPRRDATRYCRAERPVVARIGELHRPHRAIARGLRDRWVTATCTAQTGLAAG